MGLVAGSGMRPDSVTTSGGALQFWSSAANTTDKWSAENSGRPYSNAVAYFGRNSSRPYYNAAICFKTGDFRGRGRRVTVNVSVQQTAWQSGVAYAAQLSRHDWSTAAAWSAGSKSAYSASMTALPYDASAVAKTAGSVPYGSGNQTVAIAFDATILPNTEYVVYIIGTSDNPGELVTLNATSTHPLSVTVTG